MTQTNCPYGVRHLTGGDASLCSGSAESGSRRHRRLACSRTASAGRTSGRATGNIYNRIDPNDSFGWGSMSVCSSARMPKWASFSGNQPTTPRSADEPKKTSAT